MEIVWWLSVAAIQGVIVGGFCCYLASEKGRNGWDWFILGVLFSLVALLVLMSLPVAREKTDTRLVDKKTGIWRRVS
tara:strand:+ start:235 stop:465 length:231 start_codon:yes stop_codon:yes gene_type:complete